MSDDPIDISLNDLEFSEAVKRAARSLTVIHLETRGRSERYTVASSRGSDQLYTVGLFFDDERQLLMSACTCQHGQHRPYQATCKHVWAALEKSQSSQQRTQQFHDDLEDHNDSGI